MIEINEIVGIDPGLTAMGCFCLHPSGRPSRYAVIGTHAKSRPGMHAERSFNHAKKLYDWISRFPGIKIIAIEGSAYNKKRSSSMSVLDRLRQSCYDMAAFYLEDFFYIEVPPTTAKKAATGDGKASKEDVSRAVSESFGLDLRDDAITDAAAVAIAAYAQWEKMK